VILVKTALRLGDSNRRFDLFWLIPVSWKFRKALTEVLIGVFAIQILALTTLLFSHMTPIKEKTVTIKKQMSTLQKAFLLVAFILVTGTDSAVAADSGQGRVVSVTRMVKIFSEQESALATSVQAHNMVVIEKILADDFEMRIGSGPGNPIPRSEWIRQSLKEPGPPFTIGQMAVHDYGNTAVVSFRQAATVGDKSDRIDIFVVDVWTRKDTSTDTSWKLAVRYASPVGESDYAIPGASKDRSDVDFKKRY